MRVEGGAGVGWINDGRTSPSWLDVLVSTERACVWTLGGILDDEQFARLLDVSRSALKPFTTGREATQFDMPSLIETAQKH